MNPTDRDFFVVMNSNAAPFFSDTSDVFVEAASPEAALEIARAEYTHPAGLYAARVYASANAYHKREPHLGEYLSERAKEQS